MQETFKINMKTKLLIR